MRHRVFMFVRNGLEVFANRSERTRRTLRKGEVRFNGRISDVLTTNHFDSALDLDQTLMLQVHLYNTQLPQSAMRSRDPTQAMKDRNKFHPHLFVKSPRNHTGRGSCKCKPKG